MARLVVQGVIEPFLLINVKYGREFLPAVKHENQAGFAITVLLGKRSVFYSFAKNLYAIYVILIPKPQYTDFEETGSWDMPHRPPPCNNY